MNDVRKALIWGIENPPREYTIEEWFIIAEFARHVAERSKESLRQEVIEKLKQSKPCVAIDTESDINESLNATLNYKCPDCKYMANDCGEEPCCDCHDSDKFEKNMKKEYEQFQRGMKEFAKGKIGRFGEVPPSISKEDIIDCVECNLNFKCNECKYRDCEVNEYPCDECEKSSKFEKRKTK